MAKEFEVIDHSKECLDELEKALERAMEKVGMTVEGYAKMKAPVGTPESTGIPGYLGGTLRNSITYATKGKKGKTITLKKGDKVNLTATNHGGREEDVANDEEKCVIVGSNVFYAPYVEMGTSGTKAKAYLRPAIEDHYAEIKKIIQDEMKGEG